MNNTESPVIKVFRWRGAYLYFYRPATWWAWKRCRVERVRSRSGRVIRTRLFAAIVEVSWR